MKIHFDRATPGVTYPIDSRTVKRVLQEVVAKEIFDRIVKVRFGCNRTTSQEARIVGRGATYEIRVNFCLVESKSKLLSTKKDWVSIVEQNGGVVDREQSVVSWSRDAARRYAVFLLFHEIGHAVYAQENGLGMLNSLATSSAEERWCDTYARDVVAQLGSGFSGVNSRTVKRTERRT